MKSTESIRRLIGHSFIIVGLALFGLLAIIAHAGGWLSRAVGNIVSAPSVAARHLLTTTEIERR